MELTNAVPVKASPQEVFAVVNDVERVVSCMPGATLVGREGDAWQGRVKVKVGPITAVYAGTVRFLEVDEERHTLRVEARGADTHGSGDAEAAVALQVAPAPDGAELRLETDLVIRGKIAQFGKGAVSSVSDKLLQQFAQNLGSLLSQDRAPSAAGATGATESAGATGAVLHAADGTAGAPAADGPQSPSTQSPSTPPSRAPAGGAAAARPAVAATGGDELSGLSILVPPAVAKYAPLAGAFACGLFQGWLLGRVLTREKQQALRGRAR